MVIHFIKTVGVANQFCRLDVLRFIHHIDISSPLVPINVFTTIFCVFNNGGVTALRLVPLDAGKVGLLPVTFFLVVMLSGVGHLQVGFVQSRSVAVYRPSCFLKPPALLGLQQLLPNVECLSFKVGRYPIVSFGPRFYVPFDNLVRI